MSGYRDSDDDEDSEDARMLQELQDAAFAEQLLARRDPGSPPRLPISRRLLDVPIIGDTIGRSAYSERFVLKILMKFANLEVFNKVVKDKEFEKEISLLWEIAADKDVVRFMLQHNALDIFAFAVLPLKEDHPRLSEIVVGILANMCCLKESVTELVKNKNLFFWALGNMKSAYAPGIIQSLRVVSHCLYLTEEKDRHKIMSMFEEFQYTEAMCFILNNSSNKYLLITALENFNTLCEYLNIKCLRKEFFKQFVTSEVLAAVSTAFDEIMVKHRKGLGSDSGDALERILAITLQIGLNLVWFDLNTPQIYTENKWSVVTMITQIVSYYEHKIVHNKLIDTDLEHIFQAANMILTSLNVSEITEPNKFFFPGFRIWKTMILKKNKYGQPLCEEKEMTVDKSMLALSEFLSIYMSQCSEENFETVIKVIGDYYLGIVMRTDDQDIKGIVKSRVAEAKAKKLIP